MAIVKVLRPRKNFSVKGGHRTSQAATRAGEYYTWGREYRRAYGDGEARGEWYGPEGKESWEDVEAWARQQSLAHPYTFKLVLSCKGGVRLEAEAWRRVMASQRVFADWRVICHADTAYRHAHVLCFGDRVYGERGEKVVPPREFRPWFEALRHEISVLERQAEREQQTAQPQVPQGHAAERRRERQIEM